MPQNNALLRFSKEMTQYDPLLQKRVEGLYHKFFEGTGTLTALDNLRSEVGDNELETEGDGVFGLANAQGYNDELTPKETIDDKINQGIEDGNLGDFGTAITTETPPTEDDFGLGGMDEDIGDSSMDSLGGDGLDGMEFDDSGLNSEVDSGNNDDGGLFGDTGASEDIGLDGLDDELPDETVGGDDTSLTESVGGAMLENLRGDALKIAGGTPTSTKQDKPQYGVLVVPYDKGVLKNNDAVADLAYAIQTVVKPLKQSIAIRPALGTIQFYLARPSNAAQAGNADLSTIADYAKNKLYGASGSPLDTVKVNQIWFEPLDANKFNQIVHEQHNSL